MKGLLSKIEYIVIGIFALIFVFWTFSKCNSQKQKAAEQAAIEAREDSLANARQNPVPANTTAAVPQPGLQPSATSPQANGLSAPPSTATVPTTATSPTQQPNAANPAAAPQPAPATDTKEPQYSKLFVTIDKLKLRKAPGLKAEVLGELKLFDEVYYLNQVTDSTYEVNLGKEMANEPYVKIKTKRGTVGWVYGAGVHYVKKKRSGVLE